MGVCHWGDSGRGRFDLHSTGVFLNGYWRGGVDVGDGVGNGGDSSLPGSTWGDTNIDGRDQVRNGAGNGTQEWHHVLFSCSGHCSFTIGCAQNVQAHMRGPTIRREWFTISWGWFAISWDMHQVSVTRGGRGECVHQRGTVGTRNFCHKASKCGDRPELTWAVGAARQDNKLHSDSSSREPIWGPIGRPVGN